jgi:WXXGXW repeat (2 copies)
MTIKPLLLCVALGVGSGILPTLASARVNVEIDVAPPAPRVEVVPAARAGYVWAPGYWNWSGHEHVWVGGRWVGERHGHHWVNDRWVEHNHHWRREEGHWD